MNDDLISRQAAVYAFADWFNGTENTIMELTFNECKSVIESVQSAQPEKMWIPVTERLPEEIGTYMTTIDYGKHGLAVGQRFYHGALGWEDECVIAWMPLQKPWKGDSDAEVH